MVLVDPATARLPGPARPPRPRRWARAAMCACAGGPSTETGTSRRIPVVERRGVAGVRRIVVVAGVRGARQTSCAQARRKSIGWAFRCVSWLLASRGRRWQGAGRAARSTNHAAGVGRGSGSGSGCRGRSKASTWAASRVRRAGERGTDAGCTHRKDEGRIAQVRGASSPGRAAPADMLNCALLGDVTLVDRFAHRAFSTRHPRPSICP
jgi:hypothetical protein